MINNKKIILLFVSWFLLIMWLGLIFVFSNQSGSESSELSLEVTGYVVRIVNAVVPSAEISKVELHNFVRKNAHFFVYFVLAILTMNAFKRCGLKKGKLILSVISFCLLIAVLDEIHQLYVPGRYGSIFDVVIDVMGSLLGILIYYGVSRIYRNKHGKTC